MRLPPPRRTNKTARFPLPLRGSSGSQTEALAPHVFALILAFAFALERHSTLVRPWDLCGLISRLSASYGRLPVRNSGIRDSDMNILRRRWFNEWQLAIR